MHILMVFINNSNAINNKYNYDIRYKVFYDMSLLLKERGHTIYVSPCDDGTKLTKDLYDKFIIFSEKKHKHLIQLYIGWSPAMIKNNIKSKYSNIPTIFYENGHMKDSVIIDPNGLFEKSKYINTLNKLCEINYDENKCNNFIENYLNSNSSKRPQSSVIDIPQNINKKYIFIPTQKINDISLKNSKVSMFKCITETCYFCKSKQIPLVIKIHPHLKGIAKQNQIDYINKLIKDLEYTNIYLSSTSINYLMKNSRFTVSLNGGSIMDNFINNTPILVLIHSMYSKTDAVVFSDNIQDGLNKMFNSDYNITKMLKKQKQIVWWYITHNLFAYNIPEDNINILQKHITNIIL